MTRHLCCAVVLAAIAGIAPAQTYDVNWASGTGAVYLTPSSVLTGDFNANGMPDLLVDGRIYLDPVVNGIGTPSGVLPATYSVPFAVCDIDGDGNLDVLGLVTFVSSQLWAYLGHGDGTFTAQVIPIAFPQGAVINKAIAGDLDGDGRPDLVLEVATPTAITLRAFRNLGGQWTESWSLSPAATPARPCLADFDGDGVLDLFWIADPTMYPGGAPAAPGLIDHAFVARGNGAGGFGPVSAFPLGLSGASVTDLVIADLDRDGRSDVVVVASSAPEFHFLYGSAALTLEPAVARAWPANLGPLSGPGVTKRHVFAYDADQDGDGDLVVIQSIVPPNVTWLPGLAATMNVRIWNGTGNRCFVGAVREDAVIPAPQGSFFVPADFDADGDVDLIGVPGSMNTAAYLENRSLRGSGCPGLGLTAPMNHQGDLTLGNAGYWVSLTGARPFSAAAFAVSTGLAASPTSGCGIYLDLAASHLVLPAGPFGLTTTDFMGNAILGIPLPASPALAGQVFYSQWFVADPLGQLSAAAGTFAASSARTLVLW